MCIAFLCQRRAKKGRLYTCRPMDCTLVRISLICTHCSLCVDSMCLLKFDVDEPVALLCSSQYLHFAFFVLVFLSNSISSYEWLRINGRRAPLFAIIYLFFLFPPVQLSPAILVISCVNLLGLLSKPRIYLKDVSTGTQT